MIRKISILILAVLSMFFVGCAALNIERTVSMNNEFYSSYTPKIQVNVNQDFTYLGEFQDSRYVAHKESSGGTTIAIHTYTFIEPDENNYVNKGVAIKITTIDEGYVLPDLYSNVKNPIDSGFTKINGEQYQYCITPSTSIMTSDERKLKNLIVSKGYHFSNLYLVKLLGRRVDAENKTKFEIYYIEDLSHLDSTNDRYWKANCLSLNQIEFVKEFEKNVQKSFQLMLPQQSIKRPKSLFAENNVKAMFLEGSIPRFEGRITPITIPVQPQYKQADGTYTALTMKDHSEEDFVNHVAASELSMETMAKEMGISKKELKRVLSRATRKPANVDAGNKYSEIQFSGNYKISALGDLLVADWNLTQLKVDGKNISPKLPLMNCRFLMSKYGETKEKEFSYPALDEIKISKSEVEKFDALMRKDMNQVNYTLSKTSVRTGDIIAPIPIENLLQQCTGNNCVLKNTTGTMGYVVKGWGYYKGKKVMVSSLDYQTDLELAGLTNDIQSQMYGYVLFDSDTFQIVKSEILSLMTFDDFTMKILHIFNAESKE